MCRQLTAAVSRRTPGTVPVGGCNAPPSLAHGRAAAAPSECACTAWPARVHWGCPALLIACCCLPPGTALLMEGEAQPGEPHSTRFFLVSSVVASCRAFLSPSLTPLIGGDPTTHCWQPLTGGSHSLHASPGGRRLAMQQGSRCLSGCNPPETHNARRQTLTQAASVSHSPVGSGTYQHRQRLCMCPTAASCMQRCAVAGHLPSAH